MEIAFVLWAIGIAVFAYGLGYAMGCRPRPPSEALLATVAFVHRIATDPRSFAPGLSPIETLDAIVQEARELMGGGEEKKR